MKKTILFTGLLLAGFIFAGCGGSSSPEGSNTENRRNTQITTDNDKPLVETPSDTSLDNKFKLVKGVYQKDNTVIHINDSGYVNVYTYDLFNSCLNDVKEGEISYLLDGKTLQHDNDAHIFSVLDDNQNKYEIHYDKNGIKNFSLGGITGASLNINGTMLTNKKSTQFSEDNISTNMCSNVTPKFSLESRTLASSSITNNQDKQVPQINSFKVIGLVPVQDNRVVVSDGFKIMLDLAESSSNRVINLFFNKDSAPEFSTAEHYLTLSNTTDKIEVSCIKKDNSYECSMDDNSVLLENNVTNDAYLDLFVCKTETVSYVTCSYADVLVRF